MKLPWQKSDSNDTDATDAQAQEGAAGSAASENAEKPLPKGYTPPKGKETPKRRDQEIARGVVRDPNAMTTAESAQRHKELKKSMTKQEWKEYKRKNREENRARNKEVQARMDAGDERYLMDRDRGPERAYVRNWVDSRKHMNNWVMPAALILLVVMLLGQWFPALANILSLVALVFIFVLIVEGVAIGRGANKAAREKFPDSNVTGFGLGMYAYSRASQPRKWRTPKPQVEIGADV
ncbi:DUF3043 domain-containing protein [Corynebacterium lubricantis]|uniref:DUF3043 domain-containing protein n=1 Tax=Corynebacterium lubricantis TaxID=541095 RepID=UPI00037E04F5|nr:DUF3043 domain-containing protein [Corynebacterium lubricantis]